MTANISVKLLNGFKDSCQMNKLVCAKVVQQPGDLIATSLVLEPLDRNIVSTLCRFLGKPSKASCTIHVPVVLLKKHVYAIITQYMYMGQ